MYYLSVSVNLSTLHFSTNQVEVVENQRGFIHLTQDQQNLVVNELFVLLQIAVHVLLKFITDLIKVWGKNSLGLCFCF